MKNYDCVIAGGGPAGSLCAAILARWGRSVLLIQEQHVAAKLPAETLVPTALPSFERYGLADILQRTEFKGTARQGAIWGSSEVRWRETSTGGRGFRIDRNSFDLALRMHAAECGAEVLQGWRVAKPLEDSEPWSLRGTNGVEQLVQGTARVAACGIPHGNSSSDQTVQTCALWMRVTHVSEYDDATLIEAVREGWLWWLPLGQGEHCLTLFADLDEVKEHGRDEMFASALRGALGPAQQVKAGKVRGTLCTPTLHRPMGTVLLAGDAASSVDPLSSQGVEKALASAEDCAYAANTWLETPALRQELGRHRTHWEARLFRAHQHDTREFYRKEARFEDAAFWRKRQQGKNPSQAARLPETRFERNPKLKESIALERNGRCFEARPAFALSTTGESLSRIGRVEIALLLELLPGDITAILDRARTHPRCASLTPRLVTEAIAELKRIGFVS